MNTYAAGKTTPTNAARPSEAKRSGTAGQRQGGEEFARLLLAKALPPDLYQDPKQALKLLAKLDPKLDLKEAFDLSGLVDPTLVAFAAGLRRFDAAEAETTPAAVDGVAPMPAGARDAGATMPEMSARQPQAPEMSASRATIEAALKGDPLPAVTALGTNEAVWEASVREPRGVAIEMRATREVTNGIGASHNAWTLTVGSPALEAALLARHVPRLSERLRSRGVDQAHVRIEGDDTGE